MSYILKTNYADRSNYGGYRSVSKIKYIVIHYTANDGDTDESNARFFKTPNRKASAHYFVDDDSVTISVPDTYIAWSVGGNRYSDYKSTGGATYYKICTNTNSINIELCDTQKNGENDVSEKTLENAIELIRTLMKKYNVPINNVIRHFDTTGKKCPSYFVDNTKWNDFKTRISSTSTNQGVASDTSKYIYNGLDYSLVFNPTYYADTYADLKKAFGTNTTALWNHFTKNGMKEGRKASINFDVKVYKKNYADLRAVFGENLPLYYQHYVTNGNKEGRKAI